MRKWIAIAAGIIVLALVNFTIYQREHLLRDGKVVLLELAPVDPRSLMQGDYMALNFAIANQAFPWNMRGKLTDGHLVVTLDANGVGKLRRIADGKPLAAGEVLLRYRVRNEQTKFATNAFFFQEGQGTLYEKARYGEFRVAPDGEMILDAMRDAQFRRLGVAQQDLRPAP